MDTGHLIQDPQPGASKNATGSYCVIKTKANDSTDTMIVFPTNVRIFLVQLWTSLLEIYLQSVHATPYILQEWVLMLDGLFH